MKNKLHYLIILTLPFLLSGCLNLGSAWNMGW